MAVGEDHHTLTERDVVADGDLCRRIEGARVIDSAVLADTDLRRGATTSVHKHHASNGASASYLHT